MPLFVNPLSENNAQSLSKFGFSVEVEAIVQPWKVRPEWSNKPQLYYERLALALRNRGLDAVADDLAGRYQAQHAEYYDKWFITRDGSLQGTGDQVCLEAVSPILETGSLDWEEQLALFWEAMKVVFKVQENFTCGSHIHVAPVRQNYTLSQLKMIAFAVVVYEDLAHYILPQSRQENSYCKRNSKVSPELQNLLQGKKNKVTFKAVGNRIKQISSKEEIRNLMQGTQDGNRYVIWNFKNIAGTGTVEFRGGRHLRGLNRTLWWITFAVTFISLALNMDILDKNASVYNSPSSSDGPFQRQLFSFWEKIKKEADRLQMGGNLPSSWKRMKELQGSS